MRDIMISTGFYDTQWRKYEAGGGLNLRSLMKIAQALRVTLVELFDGLGQWPEFTVQEIQAKHSIRPEVDAEPDPKLDPELIPKPKPRRERIVSESASLKPTGTKKGAKANPEPRPRAKSPSRTLSK